MTHVRNLKSRAGECNVVGAARAARPAVARRPRRRGETAPRAQNWAPVGHRPFVQAPKRLSFYSSCQPTPQSTKRSATFRRGRAPRPQRESSCARKSTTSARGSTVPVRLTRRSPSVCRRRGELACPSNRRGKGARRRGPSARRRLPTRKGKSAGCRVLLRRGADRRWSAPSNERAARRPRPRRSPGRRGAPRNGDPAPIVRAQPSRRSRPRGSRGRVAAKRAAASRKREGG
jgi:hypothetical protein